MTSQEWIASFGPFDEDRNAILIDSLPTTQSVRDGRPMHAVSGSAP